MQRGDRAVPGRWALPGGFVPPGRGPRRAAAARELAEETGLSADRCAPRAAGVLRRPRPRPAQAGGHASPTSPWRRPARARGRERRGLGAWRPVDELRRPPGRLAFDHATILPDGVERARAKLEYTPLATAFCPPEFTVAELRRVYEVVWGTAARPPQLPSQGHRYRRASSSRPGHLAPGRRPARPGCSAAAGDDPPPAACARGGDLEPATYQGPPRLSSPRPQVYPRRRPGAPGLRWSHDGHLDPGRPTRSTPPTSSRADVTARTGRRGALDLGARSPAVGST